MNATDEAVARVVETPSMAPLDPEEEATFRGYAWSYFSYHAEQRMKTFNFFLIAAGLLASAIGSALKDGAKTLWICPLGLVMCLVSAIFWKLDRRNKRLVENGERAIKILDNMHNLPDIDNAPNPLKIIERDDFVTDKSKRWPMKRHFGYSKCLGATFLIFILLGLYFAGASFFLRSS